MYANILVAIDGSNVARRGLEHAVSLARALGSRLHVVHVSEPSTVGRMDFSYAPPEQLIDDWRVAGERLVPDAVDWARSHGAAAQGRLVCDPGLSVHAVILREAAACAADLIVMGVHGGVAPDSDAIGDEAAFILRHNRIPLLLVGS